MKKEVSAGAVLYKIVNNKILYLLLHSSLGHITLSKGHLEGNETLLEAAKREIFEETSLEVNIDTNFVHKITYSPFEGIIKDVYFYVAEIISNNKPIDVHDDEIINYSFLEYDLAYHTLTHNSDKETLKLANSYLLNRGLKNDFIK